MLISVLYVCTTTSLDFSQGLRTTVNTLALTVFLPHPAWENLRITFPIGDVCRITFPIGDVCVFVGHLIALTCGRESCGSLRHRIAAISKMAFVSGGGWLWSERAHREVVD